MTEESVPRPIFFSLYPFPYITKVVFIFSYIKNYAIPYVTYQYLITPPNSFVGCNSIIWSYTEKSPDEYYPCHLDPNYQVVYLQIRIMTMITISLRFRNIS